MSQQIYQVRFKRLVFTVYDDCVSIKDKGSAVRTYININKALHNTSAPTREGFSSGGEKRLYYSKISSVQYREPTKLDYGEIVFDFAGAPPYERNSGQRDFLFSKNEAAVMANAYEYIQCKVNDPNSTPSFEPQSNLEQTAPMPKQNIGIHILLFCLTAGIGNIFYALSVSKAKKTWQEQQDK